MVIKLSYLVLHIYLDTTTEQKIYKEVETNVVNRRVIKRDYGGVAVEIVQLANEIVDVVSFSLLLGGCEQQQHFVLTRRKLHVQRSDLQTTHFKTKTFIIIRNLKFIIT